MLQLRLRLTLPFDVYLFHWLGLHCGRPIHPALLLLELILIHLSEHTLTMMDARRRDRLQCRLIKLCSCMACNSWQGFAWWRVLVIG